MSTSESNTKADAVRQNTESACDAYENTEKEYERRLSLREDELERVRVRHRRLWTYFALALLAATVFASLAPIWHSIPFVWSLPPFTVSLYVIRLLMLNARRHSRVSRIVNFYRLALGRVNHEWQGRGVSGTEFLPENHLYASDLDLFGTGSLFELLCTARTGVGRTMLAKWLLNPADRNEVEKRQLAVAELRDMLDFREDWAAVGSVASDGVGLSAISDWAASPDVTYPRFMRGLALILPICLVLLAISVRMGAFGHHWLWPVAIVIPLEGLLAGVLLKKTKATAANVLLPSFELKLLAPLLDRLAKLSVRSQLLQELQSRLYAPTFSPAERIRALNVLVWLLQLRQIEFFALPSSLILWGTNVSILVEGWRQRNRDALAAWLDALGQFEALLCLARYSYENPDHTFPVLEPDSSTLFEAESLGHPLLNRKNCVRCTIELHPKTRQLIVVSGSNMSGKSTLLRSIGTNSVLALAGAPVRASRLRISPLQLGCSINTHDSIRDGKSRFQVEVERLKLIIACSRDANLLFLLDEMLGGTNSNDRYFGAKAVIDELVECGAVGLMTTHDLALTEIVSSLGSRAVNVHFAEQYENGEMEFDYRMRIGVLTHTNGLNVMAALGLLPQRRS